MKGPFHSIGLHHIGADLDRSVAEPLNEQLSARIAALIASGALPVGSKLPASRELARMIGVSRNTVIMAYEELAVRGLLQSRRGSGCYVERRAPEPAVPLVEQSGLTKARAMLLAENEDRYGQIAAALQLSLPARPFRINFPAIDAFPLKQWASDTSRLLRRFASDPRRMILGEGSPSGDPGLREAVAEHLLVSRGVRCTAENVLIFAGADQALDVVLRVIVGREDTIWCEDPSYRGMMASLLAFTPHVKPIPVDKTGMNVEYAIDRFPNARAAYVFPANQFPLSVAMSLERRRRLIAWAEANRAWIIESDYDSELRYAGRPLPSLHSLDVSGSVIHIGTFSKIMFPSLRIGYAVVPLRILDACIGARSVAGRIPILDQMLVSDFIRSGSLSRHVRRMRNLYANRQRALLGALDAEAGDYVRISPVECGMNVLVWLDKRIDDRVIADRCTNLGLEVLPLSVFIAHKKRRPALLLGFTAFKPSEMTEAISLVGAVLKEEHLVVLQGRPK